jgi:hypothetical protein
VNGTPSGKRRGTDCFFRFFFLVCISIICAVCVQRAMPDFPGDSRQDSLFLDTLIVHCRIASGLGLGISDENPVELATV